MIPGVNPLEQLQTDATAYLQGNPATGMVPFNSYRKMTIESAQDEALAAWKIRVPGKVGLACLVMMPTLRVVTPNVPGPQYDVALLIRTFHDPKVNNTGMSAEDVALANLRWLDGKIFEGLTNLVGDTRGEALAPNYSFPGMLVYDTTLSGPLPMDLQGMTAQPDIQDDDAGNVTLSCIDGAARIYFSLDNACPMPPANASEAAQSSTQLYTGPFAVPNGTLVRCLAWNPALLPSHVAQGTVNIP